MELEIQRARHNREYQTLNLATHLTSPSPAPHSLYRADPPRSSATDSESSPPPSTRRGLRSVCSTCHKRSPGRKGRERTADRLVPSASRLRSSVPESRPRFCPV